MSFEDARTEMVAARWRAALEAERAAGPAPKCPICADTGLVPDINAHGDAYGLIECGCREQQAVIDHDEELNNR